MGMRYEIKPKFAYINTTSDFVPKFLMTNTKNEALA